jgi:ribonuclease-3
MKKGELAGLELALGHGFKRRELLETALTHTSHAHESASRPGNGAAGCAHNEQMEFLGDAVLGLAASEALFRGYPDFQEGQLSKLRAHLVSETNLIKVAEKLRLGRYLKLGRGEEKSGGRSKPALLANTLEAIIGAIYLDGGLETTQRFVRDVVVDPELRRLQKEGDGELAITDYKSELQERMHALGHSRPDYVLIDETGPEHQKTFTVEARIPGVGPRAKPQYVGRASGPTKKKAEQASAKLALDYLNKARNSAGERAKHLPVEKQAAPAASRARMRATATR